MSRSFIAEAMAAASLAVSQATASSSTLLAIIGVVLVTVLFHKSPALPGPRVRLSLSASSMSRTSSAYSSACSGTPHGLVALHCMHCTAHCTALQAGRGLLAGLHPAGAALCEAVLIQASKCTAASGAERRLFRLLCTAGLLAGLARC